MEILLIENGHQVQSHFPSLVTSMAGTETNSTARRSGTDNFIALFQHLMESQEFNTTQGIKSKSKVLMDKRRTRTQLGLDIVFRIKTHICMTAASGTQTISSNGSLRDQ